MVHWYVFFDMPFLPLQILNAVLYVQVSLGSCLQHLECFSVTFLINDTLFFTQQVECRFYSLKPSAPSSVGAPTTLDNGILSIISWFKRGIVFHIKNETLWTANGYIMQYICTDPRPWTFQWTVLSVWQLPLQNITWYGKHYILRKCW